MNNLQAQLSNLSQKQFGYRDHIEKNQRKMVNLGQMNQKPMGIDSKNQFHFLDKQDNKNINFGLEKFFGKRIETRNKIEKDKGLIRHINALGGMENTFESKIQNIL